MSWYDEASVTDFLTRIPCPGCHNSIWMDELCCDTCYAKLPYRIRRRLRVQRRKSNAEAYEEAIGLAWAWLKERRLR